MPKRRKRRTRRKQKRQNRLDLQPDSRRHISNIVQICVGILLLLSLRQEAGILGQVINQFFTFFFGSWGWIVPVLLIVSAFFQWSLSRTQMDTRKTIGITLCLISFLGLMHIKAPLEEIAIRRDELAGAVGFMVSLPFLLFLSRQVAYTVLASILLIGLIIAFEPDIRSLYTGVQKLLEKSPKKDTRTKVRKEIKEEEWEDEEIEDLVEEDREAPELNIVRPAFAKETEKGNLSTKKHTKVQKDSDGKDILKVKDTRFEEWEFPEYDLLDEAQSELLIDDEHLKKQARLIEEKLEEFDIDVVVRDARPGPTVTQFTLEPSEGVKLSRIASLKNDLALALAAKSLRIEAPIPGKSLVGIEMPNPTSTIVHLREILESEEFSNRESSLTLPLGRNVSGDAMIYELDDMPHLLIAGATGTGKSVCMNSILLSLLFQNAPHELKFILIDPKRVELMLYDNIPHLLHPVITDSEKALQAFRWAVAEMGRRLHRFSDKGVRNIDEYNEKQTEEDDILSRIIIVVDELADLMMREYRRDTETMIVRIAQMARATGIHLIISTQRPSVDVITGLIKANIPTRIALRTVSSIDSRTIIDSIGAEELLGRGDMLFQTAETTKPIRIQGIYISTKEVERVINAVKIAGGGKITEEIPSLESESNEEMDEAAPQLIDLDKDDDGGDPLFFDAVKVVSESNKASASLLQRHLKVGYPRAAQLLDIMERKGLIGPVDGAKAREIKRDNMSQLAL